jgi:hypothetical protein
MKIIKSTIVSAVVILSASCGSESADVERSVPYVSDDFVKVYKDDQKVQCVENGVALDEMAEELTVNGIDVLCSQKGSDGEPKDTACSIDEGSINVYLINAENEPDAVALGYDNVNTLPRYSDSRCE